MMKNYFFNLVFLLICSIGSSQTLDVPIDYSNAEGGTFKLKYEFGRPYNPQLPTVIVVSDAQQFYVREGRLKQIQDELFGDKMNVLGIIPRNNNVDLQQKIRLENNGITDWKLAYTVYNSGQYANDIESVRKEILSDATDIYLYGQSGGAFLITEYLSIFPETEIKKIFLGSCLNPVIEARLGITHDNFQRDFLNRNKDTEAKLKTVLGSGCFERELVAHLFQRQNFFVGPDSLDYARKELVEHLYNCDSLYINNMKKSYQIDALNDFMDSDIGISIRVRLFEFIMPLLGGRETGSNHFYPDIENSHNTAKPLIQDVNVSNQLYNHNFNETRFRKFKGEVFILSGRYDHVADYRSCIYMCALLSHSHLFIADDDHTFKKLKSGKGYSALIKDFFLNSDSDSENWISEYDQYRWIEQ